MGDIRLEKITSIYFFKNPCHYLIRKDFQLLRNGIAGNRKEAPNMSEHRIFWNAEYF